MTRHPFPAKRSLIERIDTMKAAWDLLAPKATFSTLTLGEFVSATADCQSARERLASLRLDRRAAVSNKMRADAATRTLLKRVIAAVQADPSFGPDSSLYRAMGYITESERKKPKQADPGVAAMGKRFVSTLERLSKVKAAWSEIAPESNFGGLSLGEFQLATDPTLQARLEIVNLDAALKGAIGDRNGFDAPSLQLLKRVIAGIKADPNFGPDSSLYRALGYVPESERRSRRRTASNNEAQMPAELDKAEPGAPKAQLASDISASTRSGAMDNGEATRFRVDFAPAAHPSPAS